MPHEEERLRAATVAVIGTGEPGSAVLAALATAGVGRLVLCDARTQAAAERLRAIAPEVTVLARDRAPVGPTDVAPLAALADVVVDCAGSPGATSAACLRRGVPHIVGAGALGLTVIPGRTACWKCAGPLARGESAGPLAATVMAQDAVRVLLGRRPLTAGRLAVLDPGTRELSWRPLPGRCRHAAR
jgi:hypothetical protein